MKFFYLCRSEDVSQTSGTGRVAEIAEFDDGLVVVRWIATMNATGVASTTIFNSLEDLLKVHGHEGRTTLELTLDSEEAERLKADLRAALELLEQHGIALPAGVCKRAS